MDSGGAVDPGKRPGDPVRRRGASSMQEHVAQYMKLRKFFATVLVAGAVLLSVPSAGAQDVDSFFRVVSADDLQAFRPGAENWRVAGGVAADPEVQLHLHATPGTGVIVNTAPPGQGKDLYSAWEHGDLELELEFMLPRGGNSGVYLQGRYEVQLLDSWGVATPRFGDVGGIYQRWDERRPDGQEGFEGQAPRMNAGRAPGLWQQLRIVFRAPRFDDAGRKVENARFEEVALNGVVIHRDVAVTGPTRGSAFAEEGPLGPLRIQGDHGPVALRHIRYRPYRPERLALSSMRYRLAEGVFETLPDVAALATVREGATGGFEWELGVEDRFAVRYDGMLDVPHPGRYRFVVDLSWVDNDPHFQGKPTGAALLTVAGKEALRHPGGVQQADGYLTLEAGRVPFTLTYFKNRAWHPAHVRLFAEGAETPLQLLNAPGSLPAASLPNPILVQPAGAPVLQRSMVHHDGRMHTHAISVGDPAGVHYAYDLDTGALLSLWKGPFADATPMWHSRGNEQVMLPLGSVLTLPAAVPVARLASADAPWPAAPEAGTVRPEGYTLDATGRPAFSFALGDVVLEDALAPAADGHGLTRTLRVHDAQAEPGLWARAAAGSQVEAVREGLYAVDGRRYYVRVPPDVAGRARLRRVGGRHELLIPLTPSDGGTSTAQYTILW